jgi:DNA-binding transcriptional MerR regulator
MTISEVVDSLKEKFPDLTVSKVRFLESQGLIKPRRSRSGYRQFRKKDVERLELILKLQKERYLPLNVIKEKLKGVAEEELPLLEEEAEKKEGPIMEEEVCQETKVSPEFLQELELYELIESEDTPDGKCYKNLDYQIIRLAAELSSYGIEPRHLRMHSNFVEREMAFMEQIVLPLVRQKNPEGKRRAKDLLEKLLRSLSELERLLLKRSLEKHFGELV